LREKKRKTKREAKERKRMWPSQTLNRKEMALPQRNRFKKLSKKK